jgi:3',5'-cyclic-AMP phosphodiesterase
MPIHLLKPTHHRRRFLATVSATAIAGVSCVYADEAASDLVYLLNDTHIGENQPPDSPVPSNMRQAVVELVQRDRKPSCVLINGDLALKDGQPGDYRHFAQLLAPLRESGINVYLTLGNHDNREVFYEVMKSEHTQVPTVESRHISIVKTKYANFFLLDSLTETMVTQGTIGPEQRIWLATALDAHSHMPAIIVAHHNPRLGGDPLHFPGGLIDSEELWEVLATRRHVKAYVHGHIHDRNLAEYQGIHIINTPATSYVADRNKATTGWTSLRLTDHGVTLTTHTTDKSHPWNMEQETLVWRL